MQQRERLIIRQKKIKFKFVLTQRMGDGGSGGGRQWRFVQFDSEWVGASRMWRLKSLNICRYIYLNIWLRWEWWWCCGIECGWFGKMFYYSFCSTKNVEYLFRSYSTRWGNVELLNYLRITMGEIMFVN